MNNYILTLAALCPALALAQPSPGSYELAGERPDGSSFQASLKVSSEGGSLQVERQYQTTQYTSMEVTTQGDFMRVVYRPAAFEVSSGGLVAGLQASPSVEPGDDLMGPERLQGVLGAPRVYMALYAFSGNRVEELFTKLSAENPYSLYAVGTRVQAPRLSIAEYVAAVERALSVWKSEQHIAYDLLEFDLDPDQRDDWLSQRYTLGDDEVQPHPNPFRRATGEIVPLDDVDLRGYNVVEVSDDDFNVVALQWFAFDRHTGTLLEQFD